MLKRDGQTIQKFLAVLQTVEDKITSWRTFLNNLENLQPLIQVAQQLFRYLAEQLPPQATSLTASSSELLALTPDDLSALVLALQHVEDDQRQAAKSVLFPRGSSYLASEIGQETIEKMAQLAQEYETDYQVDTQLSWALDRIRYDEATWVSEWVVVANQDEKHLTHVILRSMYWQSTSVLETVLNLYPKAQPTTQQALLHALSWLGRWGQQTKIPPELLETAVDNYLAWLPATEDEETQRKLIKVLGYWSVARNRIQTSLQEMLTKPELSAEMQTAIYNALAHQVDDDNRQEVLAFLQASLSVHLVRGAWVRVQLAEIASAIDKTPLFKFSNKEQTSWREQVRQQLVRKID